MLKEKEIRQYGEYRTRRLVLEAWESLTAVDFDLVAYVPMTDPPPADPRLAHPNRDGSVYQGLGLEIGEWRLVKEDHSPLAIKEEQADYEETVVNEHGDGESAHEEEAAPATDWNFYKCQVCGQMVLGFDRERHIQQVHDGVQDEFVKL